MESPNGPVELLVIGFPGSRFSGRIMEELDKVVTGGTVTVVDGLLVRRDADGAVRYVELDDLDAADSAAPLARLVGEQVELVSAEDVEELAASLSPGDSAAVVVLEHTWAAGLQAAIREADGRLVAHVRVPAPVVAEVCGALDAQVAS